MHATPRTGSTVPALLLGRVTAGLSYIGLYVPRAAACCCCAFSSMMFSRCGGGIKPEEVKIIRLAWQQTLLREKIFAALNPVIEHRQRTLRHFPLWYTF
jgi:hypothetical protein